MFICLLLVFCFASVSAQSGSFHYAPVENKHIGIWPDWNSWNNNNFSWLKDKWGFSKILILSSTPTDDFSAQYINAINAGYTVDDLLILIWYHNYQYAIDNVPGENYYIGEPVEHNCAGEPTAGDKVYSSNELQQISNYLKSKRPNSNLVIDGYKRCSHLIIAGGITDKILYSSYYNWDEIPLPFCSVNLGWGDGTENVWLQGSINQSGSWRDMKEKFGNKFSMGWMHGNGDEYTELFQTADELNLETIWLYAHEGVDSAKLEIFCEAAVQAGWLKKVENNGLSVLEGSVVYKGIVETRLPNCNVSLFPESQTNHFSAATNQDGNFSFEDIPYDLYDLSIEYNGSWKGVNATDALLVLRFYAGLENFDELQILAADANNNGEVNSTDALIILRRNAGLIDQFPNGKANWVFDFPGNPYNINQPLHQIKIYCLAAGDVNGSAAP
jgi:hypothetical protein